MGSLNEEFRLKLETKKQEQEVSHPSAIVQCILFGCRRLTYGPYITPSCAFTEIFFADVACEGTRRSGKRWRKSERKRSRS